MRKPYISITLIILCFLLFATSILAQTSYLTTGLHIKNFESEIQANKDSSLLIAEMITVDYGDLQNKHGIFRVLPTRVRTDEKTFKTPVKLISITDFNNRPLKYKTIKDRYKKTITWKIGDPNKIVTGVNYYKIVYQVKNAIRFQNKNFDELYWNLVGTAWDIPIDRFSAKIHFPKEVNSQNTAVDYYTGYYGSKSKNLAVYRWVNPNTLSFSSTARLDPKRGITVSLTFPKGVFVPYEFSFWEKYENYFYLLIPLVVFIFCFILWERYGKDPKMRHSVPPEFGIPAKITPIQMGMLLSSGKWNNKLVTATIIDLAVRKFITIKEVTEKMLLFKSKDYILEKTEHFKKEELTEPEKVLTDKIFKGENSVNTLILKDRLYKGIKIQGSAYDDLIKNHWIAKGSRSFTYFFSSFGTAACISVLVLFLHIDILLSLSILLSGIILIIFSKIMPRRTRQGAELAFRIKGFELYMKTAEKYRQQFYEKENIFDRFLPYAIVFGIASLWAKKMEKIYGEEYFNNYHPAWFIGASAVSFSADSFISHLNGMASSISSSYGLGGAGFAGGGGGGGGGGSW